MRWAGDWLKDPAKLARMGKKSPVRKLSCLYLPRVLSGSFACAQRLLPATTVAGEGARMLRSTAQARPASDRRTFLSPTVSTPHSAQPDRRANSAQA